MNSLISAPARTFLDDYMRARNKRDGFPVTGVSDITEAVFDTGSDTGGMTSLALDGIRVAYRVVWHAGGTPEPGRLLIGPDSLRLLDFEEPGKLIAELAFDDLRALRLPSSTKDRRPIVLQSRHGEWIEIESELDRWILPDVLEQATSHLMATIAPHGQLLLSVRLRPGGLQPALELLRGDPPFSAMSSSVRDVFILGDEVLVLFAGGRGDQSARERNLWDVIAAWHEFIVEIGIAEHVYAQMEGLSDRIGSE